MIESEIESDPEKEVLPKTNALSKNGGTLVSTTIVVKFPVTTKWKGKNESDPVSVNVI
jgi:hypothetical protein